MYGSLVTVWTGRRPTIIIGDPKVACDLLDRRSSIYSSRPRFVVMGMSSLFLSFSPPPCVMLLIAGHGGVGVFMRTGELFTGNDSLLTMPHGDKCRKTRKIFHIGLHKSACESYKPIQEAESQRLAYDLLTNPQRFGKHLERYASSVMICVAYGRRVDDMDDPVVKKIYERMAYMSTLNV
jgi:hypothetical protein